MLHFHVYVGICVIFLVTFLDAGGALYNRQEQGGKKGYGEKAAWGEQGDEVTILLDV